MTVTVRTRGRLVRHRATWRCARPAAATRRICRRRPTTGATPTASTSRPVGDERDGSRLGTFTVRGGATLLPGVTLDFTVRHTEKAVRSRRLRRRRPARWRPPSTTARRSTPRCSSPAPTCAGTRSTARSTHEFRANHNGTITADTDRSLLPGQQPQHQRGREARLSRHLPLRHAGACGQAIRSPAASRRRTSASRPRAPSPTGWSASAAAWPTPASGAAASPTGCSSPPASAATTTTTSRTSRPGAPPPRWCCRELGMRPHASVGTAVKLPTMFEQFGTEPVLRAQPSLTPEESFGWDAGVEFTLLQGHGDPRRHLFPAPT